MKHIRYRRLSGMLLATCAAAAVAPSLAAAAHISPEYFLDNQYVGFGGAIGHRHTLTQVSARSLDGGWVCVNALADNDISVDVSVCSTTLIQHNYCNCAWLRGTAQARYFGTAVLVRAREDF